MTDRDRFELNVAAAYRVLLEDAPTEVRPAELAHQLAAAYPHRRTAIGSWRLGLVPRLAWLLLLLAALLTAMVGGLLIAGSQPPPRLPAVVAPVLPPSGQLPCPPGSTPDDSGPVGQTRPSPGYAGSMVWDQGAGRMVLLSPKLGAGYEGGLWSFDVCTNRWQLESVDPLLPDRGELAHDDDLGLTVIVGDDSVWLYDLTTNRLTRQDSIPPGWVSEVVYDPIAHVVIGRDVGTSMMWTYDVGSDTWAAVDQGAVIPPAGGTSGYQIMGYDRAADRIVLTTESGTWQLDRRAGTWTRAGGAGPIEFFIGSTILVDDETSTELLLYGHDMVVGYDTRTHDWRILSGNAAPTKGRCCDRGIGYAAAFDPLNDRLLAVGGTIWDDSYAEGWRPTDDVIGFDLATARWIELLSPSTPAGASPRPSVSN